VTPLASPATSRPSRRINGLCCGGFQAGGGADIAAGKGWVTIRLYPLPRVIESAMRKSPVPALLTVLLLTFVLAGCSSLGGLTKDKQPLSARTVSVLAALDTTPAAPMLVRVFKESSELEVWKPDSRGSYRLFKTYAICKWSGELGPKVKEGDYQSPEGFYEVTPGMMNPKSSYYLSFNTGFPNRLDRAQGRSGTNLMIHGDCKSVGCYAMTDEQMKEIYALARESFAGGNPSFKLELYPFRMTEANLTRHATNPNIAFWRNLKEGYDVLAQTQRPAAVGTCGGRYVFNAGTTSLPNDPLGACPADAAAPTTADLAVAAGNPAFS